MRGSTLDGSGRAEGARNTIPDMGYFRDATADEIERGEATNWSLKTPEDAIDLPIDERIRRTTEADLRYNHQVWVGEPEDDWVTAEQLVAQGFRPEALTTLFGPVSDGPDGISGWLVEHVDTVEETVIEPAAKLLRDSVDKEYIEALFNGSRITT